MANIQINALHNAAVYIDGASYIGQAEKVSVARPKSKTIDYKGLGLWGMAELPSGTDKLESKIKWSSFNQGAVQISVDPFTVRRFQVRSSLQQMTSAGLIAELPVVYLMRGFFKDPGSDDFEHQELDESESTIAVWYTELQVAGVQIFKYDLWSNQYIVGGVDKLTAFKANLGLL
jgi:P2 family phage contractile tail tube protein